MARKTSDAGIRKGKGKDAPPAPEPLSTSASDHLSLLDQDARTLAEAAARLTEAETGEALGAALAHNLDVWIAIRTLVTAESNPLPAEVRENLCQLAGYVVRTTLDGARETLTEAVIQSLATVNLHIAEGLMLSQRNNLIRDRAYQLWEDQGRPDGRHQENWLQAEQEIRALMATD